MNENIDKTVFSTPGGTPEWGGLRGVRPAKLISKLIDEGMAQEEAGAEFISWGVSERRTALCLRAAEVSREIKESLSPEDIALYIGIPFCPSRCLYCSFVAQSMKSALRLLEPFLETLHEEMLYAGEKMRASGLKLKSVYIGGGTPTTLNAEQLSALLTWIDEAFDMTNVREYTVEAGRPDTVDAEKLRIIKAHGADRISINPQSMDDRVLTAVGRGHTAEDIQVAFSEARDMGFVINMDLIAGLPSDSLRGFKESLDEIISLSPGNITVHTLSVKRGSRLNLEGGEIPGAGEVKAMLDYAAFILPEKGYSPYYLYRQKNTAGGFENVGWSRDGLTGFYNVCIMEELCGILSLGGGGVSKAVNPGTGYIERMFNPKYPYEYNRDRDKIKKSKDVFFDFYRRIIV